MQTIATRLNLQTPFAIVGRNLWINIAAAPERLTTRLYHHRTWWGNVERIREIIGCTLAILMAKIDENTAATLFRSARLGDQEAYGRLLQMLTPTIRGMSRAMLFNVSSEDHEDVVQDVLITIHTKGHTWQEDKPLLPWVYAVARYRIIDFGRTQSRRYQHIALDDVVEAELATEDAPSRVGVEQQIDQLGGKLSRVARCIGLEGKSITEASQLLGMSENAIRIAFHRALKKLREM